MRSFNSFAMSQAPIVVRRLNLNTDSYAGMDLHVPTRCHLGAWGQSRWNSSSVRPHRYGVRY
ncbi:hypothetical protein, partial [Salmonella enterica]|uniref:hypothetical protein n=1 Tax=Salmonella enterica TaxID=28901 RepID=UPI0038B8FBF9